MKLQIKSFVDVGVLAKERIVLRALSTMDIGSYVLLRSLKGEDDGPVSGSKAAYWFPDVTVQRGDLVVVYTRRGKSAKKELANGGTAHFYYWHKKVCLWDTSRHTAVLLDVRDWINQSPDK